MRRLAVLLAVAALGACGRSDRSSRQDAAGAKQASADRQEDLVSVNGVVQDVKERAVQVRTDDGRVLDFAMNDKVEVRLGGGESQAAVITEGAPVRVSYKPKGTGADLVAIDVEPQAAGAKAGAPSQGGDPAANPARAGGAASGTGSGDAASSGAPAGRR